jgi:glycosyltransferase involved in cell wall biosynthesis
MTEQKRKLLVATDNFLPRHDGISRFLKEILPTLTELYDVTVVCPDYGATDVEGVTIVRLPLSSRVVGDYRVPAFAFSRVKELVLEHDLVFTQGIGPIGYAAIRAAHKRVRVIHFMHSIEWELVPKAVTNPLLRPFLPGFTKWWVRKQYRKVDLVLCPSEGVAELLAWNRIDAEHRIVHLGVNTAEFSPVKDKKKAKEALGLDPERFIIGYHGRIAPEKDLKTLSRAFVRIRDATLLIVGDGVPAIKRSLQRRDVKLVGAQDNVVPYLQAMDVYVMPSLTETTCLSVLEAMSCGLPVVSTPVGYVRDYITPKENGILIQKQDSYGLARELLELQKNKLLREKLGANARRSVENRFTWDKTRKRIKEIFEGL